MFNAKLMGSVADDEIGIVFGSGSLNAWSGLKRACWLFLCDHIRRLQQSSRCDLNSNCYSQNGYIEINMVHAKYDPHVCTGHTLEFIQNMSECLSGYYFLCAAKKLNRHFYVECKVSHGVRYRRKFARVLAEYSTTVLHHQGLRFTTKHRQHLGNLPGYNLQCSMIVS